MDVSTLVRWQRYLFIVFVICLPFTTFPKAFTLPGIGQNLAYYPLLLGGLLWLWEIVKTRSFTIPKAYYWYFIFFILWQFLCTVIGFISFKDFALFDLSTWEKVQAVWAFLHHYQIPLSDVAALRLVEFSRLLKAVFITNFWTFGASLWIYHLYKNDGDRGLNHIKKAGLILIGLLMVYSAIEVAYFMGNEVAESLLLAINPHLYDVKMLNEWWPPLFWNDIQLRSIYQEPSFFGIGAAFLSPILLAYFYTAQSKKRAAFYFILLVLFSAMIFLTKARTATTLYFGELGLLFIVVATYYRQFWKRYVATLLASFLGFLFMLLVLMHPTALAGIGSVDAPVSQNEVVSIEEYSAEYMDKNVKSVVGNSRSNNARSINNWRTAEVALNNPIFGVGVGLQDIYIQNQLRAEDLENEEVRNWTRDLNKQGIIASGYPTTNHFAVTAAQTGIVGLLIYLAPFIFVLWSLVRKKILAKDFTVAALSIGLVGGIVAFMSNMAFFYVYILLGILLCVIESPNKRA